MITIHDTASSTNTELFDIPTDEGTKDDTPKGAKFIAVLGTIMLCIFLSALEMTVIATAVPAITAHFMSLDDVGWYGSASFLTQATFQATWGKAYSTFDLKWTLITAIAVFEMGNLISGLAPNSPTVILGRAIAGIGGSGTIGGAFICIAFVTTERMKVMCIGIMGATFSVASVVGPLLGGILTTHASWRWTFLFNVPIGIVTVLSLFFVFDTPQAHKNSRQPFQGFRFLLDMNLPGTLMMTAAGTCLMLAMQWGGVSYAWNDSRVIGMLVVSGLLMVIFFVNEHFMGERALAPPRLLKIWPVPGNCITTFLISGAYFPLIYFLPILFQSIQGVDAEQSGYRNIPMILSTSLFTIVASQFIGRTNLWQVPMILGPILMVIGSALIKLLDLHSTPAEWIGYQIVVGVGIGIGLQIPMIANQKSVDLADIPNMIGMTLFFELTGGAFFLSTGQAIFANGLISTLKRVAPRVDPVRIVQNGAVGLREAFPADIDAILEAYAIGLRNAFSQGLACALGATVMGAIVVGTTILRKKKTDTATTSDLEMDEDCVKLKKGP
ncbi:putative MFS transporter [Pseudovirgaria hyperparasitica]|uniref:MFS transporter n=1 Tax=Pseudovirgaria hyperparasitica TaxID=470096 RepID=A0A6A6WIS0_9PEZI|nr:putative MFS transporter [Pseudovirgaria hyperparasitica]KAF2762045.1 putative MFS transporter [Pseudovirgaria hyperparasitica]